MDRSALVVGGGRGIGKACAQELRTGGARVAVTYRTEPLAGFPSIWCDVDEHPDVSEVVRRAEDAVGPIAILILNAARLHVERLHRFSSESTAALLHTNVVAPLEFVKAAARSMIRSHWGRVIFISSIAQTVGYAGTPAYSASKGAIDGAARSLARELGPFGITVNTIRPGLIATEMSSQQHAWQDVVRREAPLRRVGQPAEVAALAAFLASEQAGYITGANISIDGGLGMGA